MHWKSRPTRASNTLLKGRSKFGRSCLNEPFRIMSGLLDEKIINSMNVLQSPLTLTVFKMTLDNLAKCVPFVLEREESSRVVAHWFPQLEQGIRQVSALRKKIKEGRNTSGCILSNAHFAVLEELTTTERILYTMAVKRWENLVYSMMREFG